MEPVWLLASDVIVLHDRAIADHGGAVGLRDPGLLESALGRPQQRYAYGGDADLATLATAYAHGVSKSHPFVDGNKRSAFATCALFLELNGYSLDLTLSDATENMVALASGGMTEDAFTDWLRGAMRAHDPED